MTFDMFAEHKRRRHLKPTLQRQTPKHDDRTGLCDKVCSSLLIRCAVVPPGAPHRAPPDKRGFLQRMPLPKILFTVLSTVVHVYPKSDDEAPFSVRRSRASDLWFTFGFSFLSSASVWTNNWHSKCVNKNVNVLALDQLPTYRVLRARTHEQHCR